MELEGGNFTKGEAQINRNERDIVDHGLALDPATSRRRSQREARLAAVGLLYSPCFVIDTIRSMERRTGKRNYRCN